MADSNITKRALSQALKELIKTRPIEKISVGNICDACGLNRKSFYYHFQDKYDLINWIYCTEFLDTALSAQSWTAFLFIPVQTHQISAYHRSNTHSSDTLSYRYDPGIVSLHPFQKNIEQLPLHSLHKGPEPDHILPW